MCAAMSIETHFSACLRAARRCLEELYRYGASMARTVVMLPALPQMSPSAFSAASCFPPPPAAASMLICRGVMPCGLETA